MKNDSRYTFAAILIVWMLVIIGLYAKPNKHIKEVLIQDGKAIMYPKAKVEFKGTPKDGWRPCIEEEGLFVHKFTVYE